MELNSLIFPSPKNTSIQQIQNNIIFVPKNPISCKDKRILLKDISAPNTARALKQSFVPIIGKRNNQRIIHCKNQFYSHDFNFVNNCQYEQSFVQNIIPCLFIRGKIDHKIILYFHGNGEDITTAYQLTKSIQNWYKYSLLAVQYPGYSIYKGSPSANIIQQDSIHIIQYLKLAGYQIQNMIIIGRSIGSGPALHISSHYKIGSLILITPFLSLRQAIKDLYGNLVSKLVVQRFDNKKKALLVNSPCLIIHGSEDSMINHYHSIQLSSKFKGYCCLKVIQGMSHSAFDYEKDFLQHMDRFLNKIKF